jgi:hypothetical protein
LARLRFDQSRARVQRLASSFLQAIRSRVMRESTIRQ